MCNDVKFVECDVGVGQMIGDTLDESGRLVDAGRADLAGIAHHVQSDIEQSPGHPQQLDRLGIAPFGNWISKQPKNCRFYRSCSLVSSA